MRLLRHLIVAVISAIPILIIGVVYMSLVREDNPGRIFFEKPVWSGNVTRGEWALFILATPVMFYSAKVRLFLEIYLFRGLTFAIQRLTGFPHEVIEGTVEYVEAWKQNDTVHTPLSFWKHEPIGVLCIFFFGNIKILINVLVFGIRFPLECPWLTSHLSLSSPSLRQKEVPPQHPLRQ